MAAAGAAEEADAISEGAWEGGEASGAGRELASKNESAAEAVWSYVPPALEKVQRAFQTSYDDAPLKPMVWSEERLRPARDKCADALGSIKATLEQVSATSSAKDKLDAVRQVRPFLIGVTEAAQMPEYWIVFRSHKLVESYQKLAADLKTKTASGFDGDPRIRFSSASWMLVPAAFQPEQAEPTPRPTPTPSLEPPYLRRLRQDVSAPVSAPVWAERLVSKEGTTPFAADMKWIFGALGGLGLLAFDNLRVRSQSRRLAARLRELERRQPA